MPDPLIQDPASTQNFNRYSYCLNNPLKYTDESGEYAFFDESGNQWNGKNINPFTVAYDGIIGAVTSWLGGALTSQVSSWIGNFTDLIPGKAVAQMLNRSLSSGVVALGTNAISAYGVSREGDLEYWEAFSAGMDNVWQAMAIGALTGTAEGIKQAREVGENPWSGKVYSV